MQLMSRNHALVSGLNHETMVGVEFGPWYSPIAPKSSGWRTIVVDFSSGNELRERARTHSSESIRNAIDAIEDVDIVWSGESLVEPLLQRSPNGYDFIIASHVFEHIPDLIELFSQLELVLKPDATISLAVPDKRFCFDYFRPLTTTDDLLLAHREKRSRHSPETLFRAMAYTASVGGSGAWWRSEASQITCIGSLRQAYSWYCNEVDSRKLSLGYVDAHAWVFTPASFELVLLEMNAIGVVKFGVTSLTEGIGSEFFVQLKHHTHQFDDKELEERRRNLLTKIIQEGSQSRPTPSDSTES